MNSSDKSKEKNNEGRNWPTWPSMTICATFSRCGCGKNEPGDPLVRKCPYTGEQISIASCVSEEVDIDHLLPFKRQPRRQCGEQDRLLATPIGTRASISVQAFGSNPTIDGHPYRWNAIASRATNLPRTSAGASIRTRWKGLTRWAGSSAARSTKRVGSPRRRATLSGAVSDPYLNLGRARPSRPSIIRGKWGLNALLPDHNYAGCRTRMKTSLRQRTTWSFPACKNRRRSPSSCDRSPVAGLTDRSLVGQHGDAYDDERDKIVMTHPWEALRDDLKPRLNSMVVSHKPDHGYQGKLHEDTAYGFARGAGRQDAGNLVYRKPIESLNENEIAARSATAACATWCGSMSTARRRRRRLPMP